MSKGIVIENIRHEVLNGIKYGFTSGYRGKGYFYRDFSSLSSPDKINLAKEKIAKDCEKGFCLGPFTECPFPNSWNDNQGYVCQIFFRPKHKFTNDGQFRMICNKSYPPGRSFNDLIERKDVCVFDPTYEYFTFQKFVEQVRRCGRNSLIALFDVKDAYKNCRMRPDQLWQQCYRIGKEYYVDLGGTFGSRNAGDNWNLTMELIVLSARHHCGVSELNYYVDNGVIVTPMKSDGSHYEEAKNDFEKVMKFLTQAGVPWHEIHKPNTNAKFLGWQVNTETMKITCTKERRKWINDIILSEDSKINKKFIQSVTGVLEFLATILPFLRAPLGWLRRRQVAQDNGKRRM